jgi:hypothetical protein
MQQQTAGAISDWIAAPNLRAQVSIDLVEVGAALGFFAVPATGYDRGELGVDNDPLSGCRVVEHDVTCAVEPCTRRRR